MSQRKQCVWLDWQKTKAMAKMLVSIWQQIRRSDLGLSHSHALKTLEHHLLHLHLHHLLSLARFENPSLT